MNTSFDIIIIGGGAAGLSCALSLDRLGLQVAIIEQAPREVLQAPPFDGRELALTHHSIDLLKAFNVWQHFKEEEIAPLRQADILTGHDVNDALRHALSFEDLTQGASASAPLGYLVSHHLVRKALYSEAKCRENITLFHGRDAMRNGASSDEAFVVLDNGTRLGARLVIGADGRFSKARQQRGIGAVVHDFRRKILVCRLGHSKAHDDIAVQWFDEGQTLAFLPLSVRGPDGQACSSLVLTLKPDEITRLAHLPEAEFTQDISTRLQGQLGEITLVSPRCTYPLKAVYAHRFRDRRFALIGDAAVGMHPITAHGFNFGLKGQHTLAKAIAEGDGDPGATPCLRQFERVHRRDTMPLFAATNAIATLYTRDTPLSLKLRRATLHMANANRPFRQMVARTLADRSS